MKKLKLNLRMFEGDGAGTSDTGSAGSQEAENGGTAELSEDENVAEEERRKSYEKFKNEYKDLYAADFQTAINRRYRENQQLHEKVSGYESLASMLATRYQVNSENVDDIIAAVEKDDSFYEEAALRENLTVPQYKKMLKLSAENRALQEAQKRAENVRQRDETWARWDRESEECAKKYPSFDQKAAFENPEFAKLLGSGVDVTTAYQALYFDDIMRGAVTQTQKDTKKQVADTIRSGSARPVENGAGNGSPASLKVDIAGMSKEEFRKLQDRVERGERIVL